MNTYKFSDLKKGLKKKIKIKVSKKIHEQFIKLSRDKNPIHINKKFARKYNFEKPIIHGMLIGSFYSKFIGVDLPGKYSLILEINIRFIKPVFVGDLLSIEGKVLSLNKVYKIATIGISTKNQKRKKVSSSEIIVKLNE
tara:strand:- start:1190 stop:1606 length:417 start_codon:yes stop_codon:yes gene_type:complete